MRCREVSDAVTEARVTAMTFGRYLMRLLTTLTLVLLVEAAGAAPKTKWTLAWSDEFNGPSDSAPDPAKWDYDLGGGGWGNHELEEYTKRPENVAVDGHGRLAIRALCNSAGQYTSGRLKTQGRFATRYGRIEARIKVPYGQGIWPAFWMLGSNIPTVGWPQSGEIDIMENTGKEHSIVHATVHGPGYSGGKGITAQTASKRNGKLSDRFHICAVEWAPDSVVFFLDRKPYARVTGRSLPAGAPWVFDQPFYLLLNVAVGGDWPGKPDQSTQFPQTMLVDWVRVWQSAQPQGKE